MVHFISNVYIVIIDNENIQKISKGGKHTISLMCANVDVIIIIMYSLLTVVRRNLYHA